MSWNGGAAPSDDMEGARNPSTLSREWKETVREQQHRIEWRGPSVIICTSGGIDNRGPAAARKRVGNVVKLNSTQYNLYMRRDRIDKAKLEDRIKGHFLVTKNYDGSARVRHQF